MLKFRTPRKKSDKLEPVKKYRVVVSLPQGYSLESSTPTAHHMYVSIPRTLHVFELDRDESDFEARILDDSLAENRDYFLIALSALAGAALSFVLSEAAVLVRSSR